jgi:phosphohistidine phosphatase SixA
VIPGLAAQDNDGSPLAMAGVVSALLDAIPDEGRALAVSHTPLVERAVLGLTARDIEPLGVMDGVRLVRDDEDGEVRLEELRRPR